jgi:hypothetical protein
MATSLSLYIFSAAFSSSAKFMVVLLMMLEIQHDVIVNKMRTKTAGEHTTMEDVAFSDVCVSDLFSL